MIAAGRSRWPTRSRRITEGDCRRCVGIAAGLAPVAERDAVSRCARPVQASKPCGIRQAFGAADTGIPLRCWTGAMGLAMSPRRCYQRHMDHFLYRDGVLHAEDVALDRLAAEVGTPFYCYSSATLRRHMRVMREAFAGMDTLLAYAMKANSNQAVLTLLASEGAGADVVSGGELERALAAGIPPERIVFSGVAKTRGEMRRALEVGIHCFNVESEPELERLQEVAADMGATARVSVRVNPNVDALTHEKISTGKAENKFGIPFERAHEVYARIAALPNLRGVGVDMHIGSQITELGPFATPLRSWRNCHRPAGGGAHDRTCRCGRRPRHSLPAGQRTAAARSNTARWSRKAAATSAANWR